MRITRISASEIGECWPKYEKILGPAIAVNDHENAEGVFKKLASGEYELALVTIGASAGLVVSCLIHLDNKKCLWLPYLIGKHTKSRTGFLRFMRSAMSHYEDLARRAGCQEIRIGGRDWSRVFPGFERFDKKKNRLRKIL